LVAHLWPAVSATPRHDTSGPAGDTEPAAIVPALRRLAAPRDRRTTGPEATPEPALRPEFVWASQAAAHVGTVVHRYLQRVAEEGLDLWNARRVAETRPRFARELELLGVERAHVDDAAARVAMALARALADPHGRWLLGPHEQARAELRMTVRAGDVLEHVRIDRTFVADGRRWIVDFKTSQHEGGDVDAFLLSEVERYAPQLERYARALAATDERPIELGLYFPLLGRLRSWPANATASPSA
jgi:ATP-dependent exoDNAse (exonuclease V) beta subunit